MLAESLGSEATRVLRTLEAAESAALVAESDEPGRYFFVHEIVRATLLDGLTGTRRSQTHAQVAEALETLPGDRVVELAYHWSRTSTPGSDDPLRIRVPATLAVTLAFDPDRERRANLVGEAGRLAREIVDEPKLLARRTADPELQFLAGFFEARLLLEAGSVSASKVALAGLAGPIAETRSSFFQFLVERMKVGIEILECQPTAEDSANELLQRSARTALDSEGAWMAHMGTLARSAGT